MPANSVIRVRSGDVVQVRTGVLRGIGPEGPVGPIGPQGPPGEQGLKGDTGMIGDLYSTLSSTAQVATGSTWTDLSYQTVVHNEILTIVDTFTFKFKEAGTYLLTAETQFNETAVGGTSTGARGVQLLNSSTATTQAIATADAVVNGATVLTLSQQVEVTSTLHTYKMQAFSKDGAAVNVSTRSIKLIRVGSGPAGVQGPPGPIGVQGSQGPAGPIGNAGSGFTTFDAVMPTDQNGNTTKLPSEDNPGGTANATADQAVPYPDGTQRPAAPYFFKTMAEYLEKRILARFASSADRTTKRGTRAVGEATWLADSGRVDVWNYGGAAATAGGVPATTPQHVPLAQVRWVTTDPATNTYYPPGTVFFKI
jgi:hypothetical protein